MRKLTARDLLELKIDHRSVEGHSVIDIGGEIDLANAPKIEKAIMTSSRCQIVNLTGVTYIDGEGIQALINGWKYHRRKVVFVFPKESRVARIWEIVFRPEAKIKSFATIDEAVAAFTPSESHSEPAVCPTLALEPA